jgi:tape measure domain-containing protein
MVTENVDIRVRETGARIIKRKFDDIGKAANNATRGIFLMQRALFVLGGAGILRGISRQLDMLTNYENRLRLTATSAKNLEDVQRSLFQVARDSRSSFESVAEIYSRTALSVRELGVSQRETLQFTESLAKATIISGASAREAHAALIQLGQGMASNTLRGDELRSVLEQLPFVADVISKSLGVTRGELRKLGSEGKISASTILTAFREAKDEIDGLFANTVPTISQAMTILNTNWLEFLDNLDDANGISAKLANSIIFLSNHIEGLVTVVVTLGAIWAASFAADQVAKVLAFVKVSKTLILRGSRLIEIENLRAASSVRRAQAQVAANAADMAAIRQGIIQLQQSRAILTQQKAEQAFTVINGRARNVLTGQFVNLTAAKANLNRTSRALLLTEAALRTSGAQLAASTAAQAGAANTLAAANTRLAGAQAASNTLTAKLSRTFPLMAGGVRIAIGAIRVLWGILAANPIGLLISLIALVVVGFAKWGNAIKVTSDGVVGLKDVAVAAFQLIYEKIAPIGTFLREQFGNAIEFVTLKFAGMGDFILSTSKTVINIFYNMFTAIPRLAIASIAGVIAALEVLPKGAANIGAAIANGLIAGFEAFANGAIKAINFVISGLNELLSFVGADAAAELFGFSGQVGKIGEISLGRFKGAGDEAGNAFAEGFADSWDSTSLDSVVSSLGTAMEPIGTAITDRARQNIDAAAEDLAMSQSLDGGNGQSGGTAPSAGSGSGSGSSKANSKDFGSILNSMQREIDLLRLTNKERKIQEEILKIEKELKRGLTDAEKSQAVAALQSLEAAKAQAEVLESIVGPREKAQEQLQALNALYEQGRIGIEDYTNALREMQIAADTTAGTMAGGFKAAINGAIMSTSELGAALGDIVVGAADKAADAIVEFAKTGKFNMKQFFADLFADITKLIAKQLILKALGFVFGFSKGGSIGGNNGLGFATGGSLGVTGPGSTDSQIVSFAKRPDERVDILTPGQQAAQRNNLNKGNGGGQTIVQSPPVNVAAVLSPSDIVGAFDGDEGDTLVINILQRNSSTVKSIVNG